MIVDNGSTDGSVGFFNENFSQIMVIKNENNLGFAEGCNVGIRKALENGTDYILLLNNDTIVDSEFLTKLVESMDSDPTIGISGPKIYYYELSGRKDILNFAGGNINFFTGRTAHIGVNEIDLGQYDSLEYVQYIEGSCMLIRKDIFYKVGFLDSNYFAYWEETDFCVRVSKAGYKILYVPMSKIWHKIGASTKKNNSFLYVYLMTRNRVLFMQKNAPLFFKITFIPFFIMDILVSLLKVLVFKRNFYYLYFFSSVILKAIFFPNNIKSHIELIIGRQKL